MGKDEKIDGGPVVQFPGTLRDWFAGMAVQVVDAAQGPEAMACDAYLIADAMLREREKAT